MHNLYLAYLVNLHMFRAYLGASSGGTTVCIQQLVLIILFRWLSVVLDDRIISTNCCIHTVVPPDDGHTPETCTGWRNILWISCASGWFFFTRLYRDARSTKHKIYPDNIWQGLQISFQNCIHFSITPIHLS